MNWTQLEIETNENENEELGLDHQLKSSVTPKVSLNLLVNRARAEPCPHLHTGFMRRMNDTETETNS
jgi:hypothetical protein